MKKEHDCIDRAQEIAAKLSELGLGARFEFVPVSQSRNAESKWAPDKNATYKQHWQPTLNWRATVTHKGRDLFTIDYSQDCAYTAAYKAPTVQLGFAHSLDRHRAMVRECEEGREYRSGLAQGPKVSPPSLADLFYSLQFDADAIEYTFEDWAENLGFDPDSRKAEKIYRECLDLAIKLRQAIGDGGLSALREMFEGY